MSSFEVTTVIPAFNVEEHIGNTIQSVLDQTYPVKEIIVVDDGSSDKTAEAVKSFPQVKYIYQQNSGVSAARNTGVNNSSTKWIAFLDGDDLWTSDKLQRQKALFDNNPQLVWAGGNCTINDFKKNIKRDVTPVKEAEKWKIENGAVNFFHHWKEFGNSSNIIMTREVFDDAGGFIPGLIRTEDTDLWLKVAYRHPMVGYLPQPCCIYNFFRPGSSNQVRDTRKREGFLDTLNVLHDHLSMSEQFGRKKEYTEILTSNLKGMARRACRTGQYDLAKHIWDNFAGYLDLNMKLYLKTNLLKAALLRKL